MNDWRTRVMLGAVLAVLAAASVVVGYEVASRRWLRNPSDATLVARFARERAALEAERRAAGAQAETLFHAPRAVWLARARFDDVKGYLYSARVPQPVVEDLDAVLVPPRKRGQVLVWHRPLEGDWYLYRRVGGKGMR